MNYTNTELKFVSTKDIPANERLIFALDVPNIEIAKNMINELGDSVNFYKLGLEIFVTGGHLELIDFLKSKNKKIFLDLKFFDVPQTVKSAVKVLNKTGVDFVTAHGNDEVLKAVISVKGDLKILAVTVLTSLDQSDLDDMGFKASIKDVVLSRAKRAMKAGCDGVISSGLEAKDLRAAYGNGFTIITPGIRPVKNTDDQKRTVDIEEAFLNGADYIVVGRPIKEHHGFDDSRQAANHIQDRIAKFFE